MSDSPLDILLREARDLYRAELDRYGQLYNRIGIFMAVFAVYANALVWLFQNGLMADHASLLLIAAACALFGLTVVGFGHLLLALWGNTLSAVQGPDFWKERREELRQPVVDQFTAEGMADPTEVQIETRLATALKEDLADDFARCAEQNMNLNERRFGYLHRASQFAGLAFVAFLAAASAHVYAAWRRGPVDGPPVRVQVVDPVRVNLNTDPQEMPLPTPPVTAPLPPAPKPQRPNVAPTRPPLPPVRQIKEGHVPAKLPQPPKR